MSENKYHVIYLHSEAAKNFRDKGTKTIYLRYNLVDAILEVASHKNQLGFFGLETAHEQSTDRDRS